MRLFTATTAGLVMSGLALAIDFSRIERWAGTGTNRAALVVDWNDGRNPHALAWGFRWNGHATTLDFIHAVTNHDSGLSFVFTNSESGLVVARIEYTRPARVGDILPETANHPALLSPYARDFTGIVFHAGRWTHWVANGQSGFEPTNLVVFPSGIVHRALQPDGWEAFAYCPSGGTQRPGRAVLPAVHYPFASAVMSYSYGIGAPPIDWISGDPFTDPSTALGRPSVDTTLGTNSAPVVPVYPAFRAHEIVSIGENGFLELAFDHRVLDHPDNPYGVDFLVFGNAAQTIGGSASWTNGDPHATTMSGSCFVENGRVLVSQDGVTWIEFTNGPYADSFAPTLGRVFDPANARTNLGAWNMWWGGATDPTIPVDPSLAPSDWAGFSVAEIARRYRGGAGGTGFDISALPLAPDENTGLKWIQFVRIERGGAWNPEVDAVADVSPLLPHPRWIFSAFGWMHDPSEESDTSDPDLDGTPNLLEYATGRDPLAPEHDSLMQLVGTSHLQYMIATNAIDVLVEVEHASTLAGPWSTSGISQAVTTLSPTSGTCEITISFPAHQALQFLRLRARHE